MCGAPLYRPCPACGSEQLSSAVFCSACGTALHDDVRRGAGAGEQHERRVVTVLFADLAGSTALGEQLDPEDVRDLQGELFGLLHAEVGRFGGMTEKFVGDAILAVFGIPQTHEDDPERAVRAALAAHERFTVFADRVRAQHRAEVGLRIGVNTGEVVASREAAAWGQLMVSGDAVNVAARLQQLAEPGEVLVGERTHAATSRAVSYGPRREIDAKGKQAEVAAWIALTVIGEPAVRPAALSAPFIGRGEELAVLDRPPGLHGRGRWVEAVGEEPATKTHRLWTRASSTGHAGDALGRPRSTRDPVRSPPFFGRQFAVRWQADDEFETSGRSQVSGAVWHDPRFACLD
jgi:class 3 adenylate cyclase